MSRFEALSLFDLAAGLPLEPPATDEAGERPSTVPENFSSASPFPPLDREAKPHRELDDEARELAASLERLLEPEVLGKLKSMSPIEIGRGVRVLSPETYIKRTLRELEIGRAWLLEAAKERARRFLEAVEPLLKEKAPEECGAKEGEDENPKACRSYFTR